MSEVSRACAPLALCAGLIGAPIAVAAFGPTVAESAETQPIESQPAETQRIEAQSIETQSTETQPTETPSTETEPIAADTSEAEPIAGEPIATTDAEPEPPDKVVLLHGLGRTSWSMLHMEAELSRAGYEPYNIGYPSTEHSIDELVDLIAAEIEACCSTGRVHFVTHSLGGILVRAFLSERELENLGRVVMLAPPNQGSEIVDVLADAELFGIGVGPTGTELGTGEASVPRQLEPVDFELGVITGDKTINPLFSWMIPGEDDGKVAVESAKVEGMSDFLVLPYSHTFIMNATEVVKQTKHFLEHGCFDSERSIC